jgi:uncharacterized protein YnzC (UPF0291/DUF896 family)
MIQAQVTSVLERLLAPLDRSMPLDFARALTELRVSPDEQTRIDELAEKCNEGQLSVDELAEYDDYIQAIHFIGILRRKAQRVLGNTASVTASIAEPPDRVPDYRQRMAEQLARLTPEQRARVEAIIARYRTPEARAEEVRERELLDREYRETGTISTRPMTADERRRWSRALGESRAPEPPDPSDEPAAN